MGSEMCIRDSRRHHSLEHFGHISATSPTICSSFCCMEILQVYLTTSRGVIIHLRISSRDIVSRHIPTGYELVTNNRRSPSLSGSSKGKDCYRAIKREATSKHQNSLVIRREASVEITFTPSSVKRTCCSVIRRESN